MSFAKIRVILADGQPALREGLRMAFERAGDVLIVAETGDKTALVKALEMHQPDALLIETGLPGLRLADIIPRLRLGQPRLRILVSVLDNELDKVPALLAAGAHACLTRKAPATEFLHAMRAVSQGGVYVSGCLASGLIALPRQAPKDDLYQLTERETEVLRFIGGGFSNKEIARRLALSVRTVETHRLNIRRKTGSARLRDLVQAAQQLGLDRPEGVAGEARPSSAPFRRPLPPA